MVASKSFTESEQTLSMLSRSFCWSFWLGDGVLGLVDETFGSGKLPVLIECEEEEPLFGGAWLRKVSGDRKGILKESGNSEPTVVGGDIDMPIIPNPLLLWFDCFC